MQPAAGQPGHLDRIGEALLRRHAADETEVLARASRDGRRPERDAVVDDRPVGVGMDARLVVADGDEAAQVAIEGVARPRHVEPAVERRDDRDPRPPGKLQVPAVDVGVDQVEVVLPVEDQLHGRVERVGRIVGETDRSQRPRARSATCSPGTFESPLANVVTS